MTDSPAANAALHDAHLIIKMQKAMCGGSDAMSEFQKAEQEREAAAYMAAIRGSIDCTRSIAHEKPPGTPVARVRATSAPATRSPLQPVQRILQQGVEQFRGKEYHASAKTFMKACQERPKSSRGQKACEGFKQSVTHTAYWDRPTDAAPAKPTVVLARSANPAPEEDIAAMIPLHLRSASDEALLDAEYEQLARRIDLDGLLPRPPEARARAAAEVHATLREDFRALKRLFVHFAALDDDAAATAAAATGATGAAVPTLSMSRSEFSRWVAAARLCGGSLNKGMCDVVRHQLVHLTLHTP